MASQVNNWREKLGSKLATPQEAVALVKDRTRVWVGGWTSVPVTLCAALAARAEELHDVEISTFLSPFAWDKPELLQHFNVTTGFVGPFDRAAVRAPHAKRPHRWERRQFSRRVRDRPD